MSSDVEIIEIPEPDQVELAYDTPDPLAGAEIVSVVDAPPPSGGGHPTGGAGGVLSGQYPNPGFAVNMATQAELDGHVADDTPHPAYDDLPSFRLIYENGLI